MLKIGEFSKLGQVTVKTLRHYDEIGLLHPAQIDQFTNYRYYRVDQLPHVHRIMALKELGLSLEQIGLMLDDELSVEQLRGMLKMKYGEIQQRVREEQEKLTRVEFHLRMLEMEGNMPTLDVIVKKIPPQYALTLRRSMKREEMVALGEEFEAALAERDIEIVGSVTEIRFEEEFQMNHEDVEFVLPVDRIHTDPVPLKSFGVLEPGTVNGLDMAATYIVRGVNPKEYQEILPVFRRWIVDHGYQLCDTHRLVFHRGPMDHAEYDDWIVEFQHEIQPVSTDTQ